MEVRKINKKTKVLAFMIITLFSLSSTANLALAEESDTKTIETVVGSYTMDGTTVYFISHLTGIIEWIVEPTGYVEWEGAMIPVDGEFWVKQGTLEHDRTITDDARISVTSISSSYIGTFKVMPMSQPPPPWNWPVPPFAPMPNDGIMNSHNLIKEFGKLGTSKQHWITRYVNGVPQTIFGKSMSPPRPPGRTSALTGEIQDWGLDTDGNSLYDCLIVSLEARIVSSGYFYVGIIGLEDSFGGIIDVNNVTYQYLESGTQFVDVQINGPLIYDSGLNPSLVYMILLNDETLNNPSELHEVPLSREYSFGEFEGWPASLTGVISDRGFDTDNNTLFDFLQIGVEVEVVEAGNYAVSASGLFDNAYNFTDYLYDSELVQLDVGTQTVYLSYNGPTIRASMINPWYIGGISIMNENGLMLDSAFTVPLPTKYSWNQFDFPGAILLKMTPFTDEGVDTDSDQKYEYLEIGIPLAVMETGTYTLQAILGDSSGNFIAVASSTLYLVKPPGLPIPQIATVQFAGSMIYNSGFNPNKILNIQLFDENYNFLGKIDERPLNHTYSYAEFDSEFP